MTDKNIGSYVPLFNNGNVMYEREENNNSKIMISKKHPELQQLMYNRTTVEIMDLCTGKRNIDDIVKQLRKKYTSENYSNLLDDTINTLHMLWRIGFINWLGNNPFAKIYSGQDGQYTFVMLDEDQAVSWMKMTSPTYITPISVIESCYSETAIKQNSFSFYETYFQMRKNDKELVTMSLITPIGRECFFKLGILNYCFSGNEGHDEVFRFIKWAASKHKQFYALSSSAESIICYVRETDCLSKKIFENELHASFIGKLKMELNDGSNILLYQVML